MWNTGKIKVRVKKQSFFCLQLTQCFTVSLLFFFLSDLNRCSSVKALAVTNGSSLNVGSTAAVIKMV